MPFFIWPARAGAARIYLTLETVLSLAFALAFTLQGLYFVQNAQLTPFQLLLVGAALEGAAFLLEAPTGVIADLYSRRLSVVLGCLFLGLGMLLVGLFPTFSVIVSAQIVSALGYTCLSGATEAWLADELGEERLGGMLLLGGQYGRLAGIAGIVLAAALSIVGLNVSILCGAALLLTLGLYLALRMPEDGFTPQLEHRDWQAFTATLLSGVQAIRASRVLGLLVLAGLLYGASSEALDRLSEYHLLRDVGLPGRGSPALWFAGLSLAGLLLGLAVTEPLRRRLEVGTSALVARLLGLLTVFSLLGLLAFAFAPGFWWAAAALTSLNVVRGLYAPLYSTWLNTGLESRSRATVNSLASQADALGQVSFGPLFGLAGNVWGVPAALALAALVRLPTLLVFRLGEKISRNQDSVP